MILLPTRRRPKLLARFVESLKETEAECPGYIIVDEKDFADNNQEYSAILATLPPRWCVLTTKGESMGDKVREVWPTVKNANPKWVGALNDDHVCLTKHWDKILETLIDGTNMVSTNDGSHNFGFRVCGLTAWSMPLLDQVGFPIFPRNLQHLYIDDVWKNIGEATGCWTETMRVNFAHKHVLFGEMEKDETFEKVYAQPSWEYDSKEFKHFMEQDFKAVCDKVIKLRETQMIEAKFQ